MPSEAWFPSPVASGTATSQHTTMTVISWNTAPRKESKVWDWRWRMRSRRFAPSTAPMRLPMPMSNTTTASPMRKRRTTDAVRPMSSGATARPMMSPAMIPTADSTEATAP